MGWQGVPVGPVHSTSERLVAEANLKRCVRAFLREGTTANLEKMRIAMAEVDR